MRLHATAAAAAIALGLAAPLAADWPEIKLRGTLRVIAGAAEQPEMFSFNPGADLGFERELVEGFASLHRTKVEVVRAKTWEERIPALLRGDGDLVIGLTETAERKKQIDFTAEVIPARHVVATCKPHASVDTTEALRAERVGLMRGSSWAEAAAEAGVTNSQWFDTLNQILDALCSGKVGATVASVPDYALALRRYPSLQAGAFLGPPTAAGWGVRKTDPELKRMIDEYLDNVRKSGAYSRLVVKYFGEQALSVLGRARAPR